MFIKKRNKIEVKKLKGKKNHKLKKYIYNQNFFKYTKKEKKEEKHKKIKFYF
jgi:hypothetical protein